MNDRRFIRSNVTISLLSISLLFTPSARLPGGAAEALTPGEAHRKAKALVSGPPEGRDPVRARELATQAAEAGHVEARGLLGYLMIRGVGGPRDLGGGMAWIEKAAEAGSDSARLNLGILLMNGEGVEKDAAEALRWVSLAAERGHTQAQAKLAEWYYFGTDTLDKDVAKAAPWARRAAEAGDAWARHLWANMLEFGQGVSPDRVAAMEWYRKAAEQGEPKAQSSLGRLLAGTGGEGDAVEAYVWLKRAAAQRENNAILFLADFVKRLTPAQIAEAEALLGKERD